MLDGGAPAFEEELIHVQCAALISLLEGSLPLVVVEEAHRIVIVVFLVLGNLLQPVLFVPAVADALFVVPAVVLEEVIIILVRAAQPFIPGVLHPAAHVVAIIIVVVFRAIGPDQIPVGVIVVAVGADGTRRVRPVDGIIVVKAVVQPPGEGLPPPLVIIIL